MHTAGLYIHIPFCQSKCAYCDFASFAGREIDMPAYADAVVAELKTRAGQTPREIATLYIGGGTPSLLPPALMDKILRAARDCFPFSPNAECTCECNPGTLTPSFLSMLRENGVNRLSFGAQAAQPGLLRMLSRIHTWTDVERSAALARDAGFANINLDLMLGLPGQTARDVSETLQRALALSPTHLSCYGLIVEEGTPLQRQVAQGVWTLPDEEIERAEYELCRRVLAAHGFEQYEISNFALPGFACRHNCDCWRRREYIGVGSAACGFVENTRYQNPRGLTAYLRGDAAESADVSPEEARFESVMLGLRMTAGVSDAEFTRMHGMTLRQAFGAKLDGPIRDGLLIWRGDALCLTRRGMDLQNRVLVELL